MFNVIMTNDYYRYIWYNYITKYVLIERINSRSKLLITIYNQISCHKCLVSITEYFQYNKLDLEYYFKCLKLKCLKVIQ